MGKVTKIGMGYDYDKLASVYNYCTYCVCGGYYKFDNSRNIVPTEPPLHPVKCQICNKKVWATLKTDNHENKTKALKNVSN